MSDRIRRLLKRVKREPVLLAAIVSVAASLGLNDAAAQIGLELTREHVAAAIGAVLVATRSQTHSRDHVEDDLYDAETGGTPGDHAEDG